MEENKKDISNNSQVGNDNALSFLKVDSLKGSYALSLLLRTDDIIVGIDKVAFRGTQKLLNEQLKENSETVLTILRKDVFLIY